MLKLTHGFVSCVSVLDLVGFLLFLAILIYQGEFLHIKYTFICTSCFCVALWNSEYVVCMSMVHTMNRNSIYIHSTHTQKWSLVTAIVAMIVAFKVILSFSTQDTCEN